MKWSDRLIKKKEKNGGEILDAYEKISGSHEEMVGSDEKKEGWDQRVF